MRNTTFLKIMSITAVVVMLNIGMLATAWAADDTIHIGSVLDFVSYSAPFDVPADEGVKLAVDEINAAGGIGVCGS